MNLIGHTLQKMLQEGFFWSGVELLACEDLREFKGGATNALVFVGVKGVCYWAVENINSICNLQLERATKIVITFALTFFSFIVMRPLIGCYFLKEAFCIKPLILKTGRFMFVYGLFATITGIGGWERTKSRGN